jgi:hypothetical protein
MSDSNDSTSAGDCVSLSPEFLEFCAKVRNNDRSILPEPGEPLSIKSLSVKKGIELADALLKNTSITDLAMETREYTKSSAEAMTKYVRSSKRLQRIYWNMEHESIPKALQRQWPSMCDPASVCNAFTGTWIGGGVIKYCNGVKKCCVVFYLHFKKARRSRNYTWNCLAAVSRPTYCSKTC